MPRLRNPEPTLGPLNLKLEEIKFHGYVTDKFSWHFCVLIVSDFSIFSSQLELVDVETGDCFIGKVQDSFRSWSGHL